MMSPGTLPTIRSACVIVDEGVRDEVRLEAHRHRELAAAVSDALLALTLVDAGVASALAIPLARKERSLALRAGLAHSLAIGLTLALGHGIKVAIGRPRPFERYREPGAPRMRSASFYSLHSAVAFASAGFSSAMHLSRAPLGVRALDVISSGAALTVAGATGALRVVSDRHYLTDVVVGAAMGLAAGLLVPLVLLRRA